MTPDLQNLRLIPPVATPLLEDATVDLSAVPRIAAHLEKGGIDAAFILGSTGELSSLDRRSRRRMITASVAAFNVPVIVGIGDNCLRETLDLDQAAAAAGASAVVLHAPSYYKIDTAGMCRYLDLVLPQLSLPVYLYNMPWLTGYSFDRETVRCGLAHANVIGIKDSSGDIEVLKMIIDECRDRPKIRIYPGNESLFLAGLQTGAHGVVGGGGNLFPGLFRELMDAFLAGDLKTASERQVKITRLGESIFPLERCPTSVFVTIKAGLAILGLCEPHMAPPLQTRSQETAEKIAAILLP